MKKNAREVLEGMRKMKTGLLEAIRERGLPAPTFIQGYYLWWLCGANYLMFECTEDGLTASRGAAGEAPLSITDIVDIPYAVVLCNEFHGWPM